MRSEEAIQQLNQMSARIERAKQSVKRKRSWRPSEKAATLADLEMDTEALKLAISALEVAGP